MSFRSHKFTRRKLLQGVGVSMALPWLEALPFCRGQSSLAVPAAHPKRFAALFMGNGISPPHWSARGSGADMTLSRSLEPLQSLRPKLNFITGLFNKQATGVG